jgi:hypothetical protein
MAAPVSHRFSEMDRKSTYVPTIPKVTPFPFLRYACLPSRLLPGCPSPAKNANLPPIPIVERQATNSDVS